MMPQQSIERLIIAARAGDSDALGTLLERHRPQLLNVARQKLDPSIQGRIDPSDVLQQTFLEAAQGFHTFRGNVEAQLFAWLRRILENNVVNVIQFHLRTEKRDVLREWLAGGDSLRQHASEQVPGKGLSPNHLAIRSEVKERVLQTMKQLPDGQHVAIRLRYIEERSLDEIAEEMGRTKLAVAGLLKRGLHQLRSQMTIDHQG